jgi:repressor LexA
MRDIGILDGDLLAVKKTNVARNGQIVVARTPDGEATIKYYYPERKRVRLLPANRKMQAILVDEVEILGVVIGVVRQIDD